MKRFSALIFAALPVLMASGQSRDSLLRQIAIATEDSVKVSLYDDLAFTYAWSNADSSIMFAEREMDLAQKINDDAGVARSYLVLSAALTTNGNYSRALDNAFKALAFFEKTNDFRNIAFANQQIGGCYREMGDYSNSLRYYYRALRIGKNKPGTTAMASGLIGAVYQRNNQPDSAIIYLKEGYKRLSDHTFINVELGNAYSKKRNYDSAMHYFRQAIPLAVQNHTEIDLIDIYYGIAVVFDKKGNPDSAAWYAKKALAEERGKSYPIGLLRAATLLSDFYQTENKPDSAFKYMKTSIILRDSLFNREKTNAFQNLAFKELDKQKEIESSKLQFQSRLKLNAVLGILFTVLAITVILFRNNRQRKKAFTLLQKQKEQTDLQKTKAEQALENLKVTQAQLVHSEKMASLGELTAGIAHEIQNPLNFVNNFSEINKELLVEMNDEIGKRNFSEVTVLSKDVTANEEKINFHGKRADAIVKGMLQHSQMSTGQKEPTDLNALVAEYLRLSYYGLRAKEKSLDILRKTDLDPAIGKLNIVTQDIGRVLLNLYNNAFYALLEKKKQQPDKFEPVIFVSTKKTNGEIQISIRDNGNGIPQKVLNKIFQPFFTTKPTGQGTGLGLSLSYDIIKSHGGRIKVETGEGEFTEFVVQIPEG
jgi:signal transduction histidine kinase/tetratricopeptide (TPR) repeat protein